MTELSKMIPARGRQRKPWREFEEAVARFAAAMDPHASVTHDIRLPDRETLRPRQRDVWIEASICNHFPVRVLVSCKRYKRKLHQTDIDHFHGELLSSSAHKGVLYSYSGFASSALEKANRLCICCCRLFHNEPADMPLALGITRQYCCLPRLQLSLSPAWHPSWGIDTWGDLLMLHDGNGGSVVDAITSAYDAEEEKAAERAGDDFPHDFAAAVELQVGERLPPLRLTALGRWRVYASRFEVVLLDGSYSYTANDFKGTVTGPSIDRCSTHPGPGWELLEQRPAKLDAPVVILCHGDTRLALLENIARQRFESPLARASCGAL
jgi:hypothetical protein